ncbi:circadian clock-controlled protein daywake-like [Achroia grisella]|uniref:circadian clock-controlled protein daywake-like n=1 Tax=Achroia grisella TaxID=688607 RepID=UPI0027D3412A|nr:circadian clock-controlled protein daywake-like [Achroia grisella]
MHRIFDCPGFIILLLFVFLAGIVESGKLNSQRPCRDSSSECLRRTLQAILPKFMSGVPEYGVENMDPFQIQKLDFDFPGNLKGQLRDGWAKGLKKCIVNSISLTDFVVDTVIHCNLTIKGKYKSSGRLLLFTINGSGDSTIKCVDIKIHNIMKLGFRELSDGQQYLTIDETKTDHSYDGRVMYQMTNLFNGSPETSKLVLDFMNENWRMVAQEFGDPMVDFGVSTVLRNIQNLFNNVSYERIVMGDF